MKVWKNNHRCKTSSNYLCATREHLLPHPTLFGVLVMKPKALHMLDKPSATELHPQPPRESSLNSKLWIFIVTCQNCSQGGTRHRGLWPNDWNRLGPNVKITSNKDVITGKESRLWLFMGNQYSMVGHDMAFNWNEQNLLSTSVTFILKYHSANPLNEKTTENSEMDFGENV